MDGEINNRNAENKVLRAEDIIPSAKEENSLAAGDAEKTEPAVPRFDLATEIMAEQRKITAGRRKKPNGKPEVSRGKPKIKSSDEFIKTTQAEVPEHDPIVAEIVAGDIQRMLRTHSFTEM